MRENIFTQAAALLRNYKEEHKRTLILLCLSAFVVLATAGILMLNGVALTHKETVLACAYQPHVHEDACYADVLDAEGNVVDRVLTCGLADYVVHTHNDDCYDRDGNLVCSLPELEAHQHTDECYENQRVLSCGLEETSGHQHTEDCYTLSRGALTCDIPEHVHSDACYDSVLTCTLDHEHTEDCFEKVLSCGFEEHEHTDECYLMENILTCGLEETPGHTHSDACYAEVRTLVCDKPEVIPHVHNDSCYETILDEDGNVVAVNRICGLPQVEVHIHGPECFYEIELTADEVEELAQEEAEPAEEETPDEAEAPDEAEQESSSPERGGVVGEADDGGVLPEAEDGGVLPEADNGDNNTEENPAQETENPLFFEEETPEEELLLEEGEDVTPEDTEEELLLEESEDITPDEEGLSENGPVVFFPEDADTASEEPEEAPEAPINDNDADASEEPADDGEASEDSETDEKTDEETTEETVEEPSEEPSEEPAPVLPAQSFSAATEDISVAVEAPEGAFPEGTELHVALVDGDEIADAAAEAVTGRVVAVQAVDISFTDAQGNEIEPLIPIRVTLLPLTTAAMPADAAPVIVHVDDAGAAELVEQAETVQEPVELDGIQLDAVTAADSALRAEAEELAFESDAFSVYAVVYTVDFTYEVDGRIYSFSIPGGAAVSMKDLLPVLGVVEEADAENFVYAIQDAVFSDESLVKVAHVEEETTLGALKDALDLVIEPTAEAADADEDIDAETDEAEEAPSPVTLLADEDELVPVDWLLISLQPFTTAETLTVTMENGDVFIIHVTDAQAGDQYGLHGKTFVITNSNRALKAQAVQNSTTLLQSAAIASDENLKWTFEYDESAFDGEGGYYLVNEIYGEKRYIKITDTGVSLVNEKNHEEIDSEGNVTITQIASPLTVLFSDRSGAYRLSADKNGSGKYLTFSNNSFGVGNNTTDPSSGEGNTWLKLRDPADPSNKPGTVGTWDILSDEISIKLYDYTGTTKGMNFAWPENQEEIREIDQFYGSRVTEAWLRDGSGVNNGRTLLFSGSGLNTPDIRGGNISWYNEFTGQTGKTDSKYSVLIQPGIVSRLLNKDGYPVLSSSYDWQQKDIDDDGSLGYLFGAGGQAGVTAYEGTNGNGLQGLLRKNDEGYYYYDSESNYAKLNDAKDEIILYSDTYDKSDASVLLKKEKIGFFPFNEYNSNEKEEKTPAGGSYNHQFGMSMETSFIYPKNGIVPDTNKPMEFQFSGDDDVWVFVDGVLVLDLGGVHQPVDGKIDFSTGVITIEEERADGGEVTSHNTTIAEMFQKATQESGVEHVFDTSEFSHHKLSFFYLERGGCDSNCSIKFNLLVCKTLTVAKKLNGLTPEEQKKYLNDEFLYELAFRHKQGELDIDLSDNDPNWNSNAWRDQFINYSTADTEHTDRNVNYTSFYHWNEEHTAIVETRGYPIDNGHIRLKAGERMTIDHLPRTDIFYLAEEDLLDMNQFETPHAERLFIDENDQTEHEEEVKLHPDTAQSDEKPDWETKPYALMDTEALVYTNTLKEKNLIVRKTWDDDRDEHDPVQFRLKAEVEGKEYTEATGYDTINAQWTQTTAEYGTVTTTENVYAPNSNDGNGILFTLSEANDWTITFEHLPKMTPSATGAGKEIEYYVEELVPEGYTVTYNYVGPDETDEEYLDLFKFWPDDNANHDGSTAEKKAEEIDLEIQTEIAGETVYVKAHQLTNGEWQFDGFVNDIDQATSFPLRTKGAYNVGSNLADMFDYATRVTVPRAYTVTTGEGDDAVKTTYYPEYTLVEPVDHDNATKGTVLFARPKREVEIVNAKGKIIVEKEWLDKEGKPLSDDDRPKGIEFTVYQLRHDHEWVQPVYDEETGTWDYSHPVAGEGWYVVSPAHYDEDGKPVNGLEKRVCRFESCGHYSETRTIVQEPCTEHTFSDWEDVGKVTCAAPGTEKHVCTKCGLVETRTKIVAHSYGDWTVTTPATCEGTGIRTHTCSVCGAEETETIPANGHTWGAWTVTTPATCEGTGIETLTCTVCGATETRPIPALGHNWDEGTITTEPTETTPGVKTYTCRNDSSHTYTETIPASGITGKIKIKVKADASKIATASWGGKIDYWEIQVDSISIYHPTETEEHKKLTDTTQINSKLNQNTLEYTLTERDAKDKDGNPILYALKVSGSNLDFGGVSGGIDGTAYTVEGMTCGIFEQYGAKYFIISPTSNNPVIEFQVHVPRTTTNSVGGLTTYGAKSAPRRLTALNAVPKDEEPGESGGTDGEETQEPADPNAPRGAATDKDLTLEKLLKDLNLTVPGVKNQNTGDTLFVFKETVSLATEADSDTRVIEKVKNAETGAEEEVPQNLWRVEIPVPLEDENGSAYRYYVIETKPEVEKDGYVITYAGQKTGLGDDGVVRITNRLKPDTADIQILKTREDGETPLAGAKFTLKKGSELVTLKEVEDGVYAYYDKDAEAGDETDPEATTPPEETTAPDPEESPEAEDTEETEDEPLTVFTVPAAGLKITGLPEGDYTLEEVEAPAGYVITEASKKTEFTVKDGGVVVMVRDEEAEAKARAENPDSDEEIVIWKETIVKDYKFTIANARGMELPSTGGMGLTAYYVMGAAVTLMAAAGCLMLRRRRARG